MPADRHTALTKHARHHGAAIGQPQVVLRKVAEQLLVQPDQCFRRIEPSGGIWAVGLELAVDLTFAQGFGADVGDCQALLAREVGVGGKVLLQRALDVAGAGVLTLDPVGVVRVHAAQELAQFGLRRLA